MIDMSKNRYKQKGISLIEVLVALVVLAFGVLGIAGLQGYSMKYNYSAYLRSQASYLASDIMDVMRLKKADAIGTSAAFNLLATMPNGTVPTSAVESDLQAWVNSLAALPDSTGAIVCNSVTSICTVTIEWDDTRGQLLDDDGNLIKQTFEMSARL